jgi:hypothetical protein
MKTTQLSPRTNSRSADDHHIWNNNGTWWCHYTIHKADYTKQRIRVSLGTRDRQEARRRRDQLLGGVAMIADTLSRALPEVAPRQRPTNKSFLTRPEIPPRSTKQAILQYA